MRSSRGAFSRVLEAILLTAVGTVVAGALPAFAQELHEFNVPAEPAPAAIRDFGSQAHVQILAAGDSVKDKQLHAVSGTFSTDQGLRILLADSGLVPRYVGDRSIAVLSGPQASVSDKNGAGTSVSSGAFLVAQASAAQAPGSPSVGASDSETTKGERKEHEQLQEVVVTGTSIPGVYPASSPLQVYSQADIRSTGAATIEQFFDQLPVNFNSLRANGASASAVEANEDLVNGIDLRGLGVGTTLVLVNGRPLAPASLGRTPDISLIPLSAVERVEVLTDGASAIYGSDAVGGVVNFVLRSDFDGAETNAGYGDATRGGYHQTTVSQTLGKDWSSGSALVTAQYSDQPNLNAAGRDFSEPAGKYTLLPQDERKSVFLSARQDLSASIKLSGDALYSWRSAGVDSVTLPGGSAEEEVVRNTSADLFLTVGIQATLPAELNFSIVSTYTRGTQDQAGENLFPPPDPTGQNTQVINNHSNTTATDFTAKLDGKLFELPGGRSRFALGAGYTKDEYDYNDLLLTGSFQPGNLSRGIYYGFGELYLPFVGQEQHISGMNLLEVTFAARYEHYSDFGSNTSPKLGLVWAPIGDLKLRGTFAESFRAPFLNQVDPANNSWAIFPLSFFSKVTAQYGLPGTDYMLYSQGNRPTLGPEKAKTKTGGFDFTPEALPGLKLSATYFDIDFRDQIGRADPGNAAVLVNPALYSYLFTLHPTEAQVANAIAGGTIFLNAAGVDPTNIAAVTAISSILYDDRVLNLAISRMSGLDASLQYVHEPFSVGAELTRLYHFDQQVNGTAPVIGILNTVTEPVSLRTRSWIGLTHGQWSGQLGVNYTGPYSNPSVPSQPSVGSWTTFDLAVAYQFHAEDALGRDLRCALAVRNLFDRNPPYVAQNVTQNAGLIEPIGYDPTNANPLGRFVSIDVSKRW